MRHTEFDIQHGEKCYIVEVSFETKTVDDSFDGHMAGYVYTYESSHEEVDLETYEITSCKDGDDNEVNPCVIEGLTLYIEQMLEQYEL
jgi:hypothetical protein